VGRKNIVVYKWVREDGTPYYIGIGNPRRPYKGRRSCGCPPPKDRIIILHENLDWEKACEIEKDLIAFYGRKDLGTGILRNLTDGGDGYPNPSEEVRRKLSKRNSGKNSPCYGRKASKETKLKLSQSHLGEKNYNYGRKFSEEHRKKISKSHIALKKDHSGKNNPRYTPRDWYHPDHGKVLQKSISELVEMFPEQNLKLNCLSRVANGKRSYHKGWIALKA
jgi:hypothetical protein